MTILIIAFIIGMLAGLAKGHTGKNVVRVISVILRAFVPMSLGYILIETFAVQTRLLPVRSNDMIGMILPMLTMILPLAGFLMNAAVSNGHRTTFAGGIGAVAVYYFCIWLLRGRLQDQYIFTIRKKQ